MYFFFFSNLKAATIHDFQTERFINDIVNIINKANNYENKIIFSIILDDEPNAFVNEDNKLFISTGLLKYTESYEALIGVLSHEIGHIDNFHISKRKNSLKKLNNLNNLTNLSLIAGSLVSNKSDYLIQSLITNKIGINNYFQSFSRDQEREADYYAIETLNKLQLSKKPLIKFLNLLEKKSQLSGINDEYRKFSSHPIYKERYDIILNTKNQKDNNFNKKIDNRFKYIKAKIFGFTENDMGTVKQYLSNDYITYAESIILSKEGKLKESFYLLNALLKKKQNYNFLLETKADILYSAGFFTEALLFYEKSILYNPYNHYVSKRIFDLKFSLLDLKNKNISLELFNDYSFLIEIFINDKILKNKFKKLASEGNIIKWNNYFSNEEKFYKKQITKKDLKKNMAEIKNTTFDNNLIKLINKYLIDINEDI